MARHTSTNVALLIDASGSMGGLERTVLEQTKQLLAQIPRGDDVHIMTFNTTVRDVHGGALFPSQYQPEGGTALWDAIYHAIDEVDDDDTPALIIVLTDGYENASTRVPASTLSRRIKQCQATDRFTFAFQVPPGAGDKLAMQLGIPRGNITEWDGTETGLRDVSHSTYVGTQSYYTARAAGRTSVDSFYTNVPRDTNLQQSLERVTGVKTWQVAGEAEIRNFFEDKGLPYVPGQAAYQLTKPELVQAYKRIYLAKKGQKAVYGGKNVRNVLGLPYTDAKLVPADHGEWDIFIESRSFNRKLVRGTRVLWFTHA